MRLGWRGHCPPAAVFIDGTPIKASANLNKKIKQEVPEAAKRYREELLVEINANREARGKKPFDDDDEPPESVGKKRDNTSKKKLARREKTEYVFFNPLVKSLRKMLIHFGCGYSLHSSR